MSPHTFSKFSYKVIFTINLNLKVFIHKIIFKNTVKDGAYVVNLDEFKSVRTYCMLLYANGNSVTYFNSYSVKYIPEEIKRFCRQQKHHNKYLQNTSIGFIDSMFKGKTLTNFTISFSPHHFKKTDEIILN